MFEPVHPRFDGTAQIWIRTFEEWRPTAFLVVDVSADVAEGYFIELLTGFHIQGASIRHYYHLENRNLFD